MTSKISSNGFTNLFKDYSPESIRAALLIHWTKANAIDFRLASRGMATQRFLDSGDDVEISLILGYLKSNVKEITLKDIEKSFEIFAAPTRKRSLGTVYTPTYIIDYLVENALKFARFSSDKNPHICDPSCGSAGFLLRAAKILEKEYSISPVESFQTLLTGIDIDKSAIANAQCLIELFLAQRNLEVPIGNLRLYQLDTLLTEKETILDITNAPDGFDVLVTNPPYVKLQNLTLDYRKELMRRYSQYAHGSFSLALLFLIRGHELLSPGGCTAMITQNNLFTSLAGKNIRRYLQDNRCIHRIVDFGHHKVFPDVSAYTCLMFLGSPKDDAFEYATFSHDLEVVPRKLADVEFTPIPYRKLNPRKWRLAHRKHLENIEQIEQIGEPLGVVSNIRVGFATLKDSVFFVHDVGNDRCVAKSGNGMTYFVEPQITRPAIKISSLQRAEELDQNSLRIIFPYEKRNGNYQIMPEDQLRDQFPLTYAYLLDYRDVLEKRDKGRKKYASWYAWGRSQGMESPGPKLLTKTFSKYPQFFLDTTDQLFCNGYGVFPKQSDLFGTTIPIAVLYRILNSRIMYYYAKLTSFQIDGDYQCYQKNFIERFGIPEISISQQDQLLTLSHQDEIDLFLASLYGLDLEDILEIVPPYSG